MQVDCVSPAISPTRSPYQRAASQAMARLESTAESIAGNRAAHSASVPKKARDAAIDQCISGGLSQFGIPMIRGTSQFPLERNSRAGWA